MDRDETILDYLQDRLPAADREAFERDMARDASLAAEVDVMRSVRVALASEPAHDRADEVWERLSAEMNAVPPAANENRRPWRQVLRYAAVAVLAVAAWQVTVVPRIGGAPEGFRTASENVDAASLQVKFVDGATIAEIAALIGPFGGTITDGPTALGLVRLSFAEPDLREAAREVLGAATGIVEFIAE